MKKNNKADKVLSHAKTYLTTQLQKKLRGAEWLQDPLYSVKDIKDAIAILNRCKYILKYKHPELTVSEITKQYQNDRRDRVSQFEKNK